MLKGGVHAGGITVHSIEGASFSYGIAVSAPMRRQGVARAALPLLFARMKAQGFTSVRVQIAPGNAASLALHQALGFTTVCREETALTMTLSL